MGLALFMIESTRVWAWERLEGVINVSLVNLHEVIRSSIGTYFFLYLPIKSKWELGILI